MPSSSNGWGQGAANNNIGWGAGVQNNDINWGKIHAESYGHDETNLTGSGFDADYQAILDKGTALGYTLPSSGQQSLQNALVLALKDAGIWSGLDVFYVFATDGDSDFATLNWTDPDSFQVTKNNSPTFTADSGFNGDGVSAFLDTNYVIGTEIGTSSYQRNDASTFTLFESEMTQTDFAAYGARYDIAPQVRNQLRMRNTDYRPAINDDRIIVGTDYRSNDWHHQRRTLSTEFTTYLDSTSFTNTITSVDPQFIDISMRLLTIHFRPSSGSPSNLFGSAEGTIKVFGMGSALDNSDLKSAVDNYIGAI